MQKIVSTTKLILLFAVLVTIAVGSVATPSNAVSEAEAAAPCPRSTSASCAYDPDTNWSYRTPEPELE